MTKVKKETKKEATFTQEQGQAVLHNTIDCQLFGVLITKPKISVIGSIQLSDAISLHPINIEYRQITSAFSSGEDKGQGTIGDEKFVSYGLYAGGGIYSPLRGKENGITAESLSHFDDAMINFSVLRTKIKRHFQPVLYLRIMRNKYGSVKGYHDYLKVETDGQVLFKRDVKLDASVLIDKLNNDKDIVEIRGFMTDEVKEHFSNLNMDIKDVSEFNESDVDLISEYVMLYEVIKTNPNGDPANFNMPRLIEGTEYGVITDLRIKRYVRDYVEKMLNLPIFISRSIPVMTPSDRVSQLIEEVSE